MIKRIRFGSSVDGGPLDAWRAAGGVPDAPVDARPLRAATCTVLADTGPNAPHGWIGLEWFADVDHLRRFDTWIASGVGPAVGELLACPVVVADEHVLRGEAWLERRWRRGGEAIKHMSVARRADGLTPETFSARWRDHAGSLGATQIPAAARGRAYVQNHPRPPAGGWAYDAVNEVYFEDLAAVRARVEFFTANRDASAADDLFGESWSFVVREDVLRVDSAR